MFYSRMCALCVAIICLSTCKNNSDVVFLESSIPMCNNLCCFLSRSNIILTGKIRSVTSTEFANMGYCENLPKIEACEETVLYAEIASTGEVIAVPQNGSTSVNGVYSQRSPCKVMNVEKTICEGDLDAGLKDGEGCRTVQEVVSTCKIPEWHYILPKARSVDEKEYMFFINKSPRPVDANKTPGMMARFEFNNGKADLSMLPGGGIFSQEEVAAIVRRLASDDNQLSFFPGAARFSDEECVLSLR